MTIARDSRDRDGHRGDAPRFPRLPAEAEQAARERGRVIWPWLAVVALAFGAVAPPAALAGRPADELLGLVPAEAGATLVVENLREHAETILGSPVIGGLAGLPAVKAWRAGPGRAKLQQARRDIEAALGTDVSAVRNDLLGDAVVLALVLPPDAPPEAARGLLLTRVRDRALLDRLIGALNAANREDGSLVRVVERKAGSGTYQVREFKPESGKPPEAYAILPGDIFAWSNSEALVREAMGRREGGLATDGRFREVRDALPDGAVASLFVDPRFLERLAASAPDGDEGRPEGERRAIAMIGRYIAALRYAGAALEWSNGPIVHLHETIDPSKLDEPLRRRVARPAPAGAAPAGLVNRVPATALAFATVHADMTALTDIATSLVPEADRAGIDNLITALGGMMLGKDLRSEILPALGPGMIAYVDEPPTAGSRPPLVFAVAIADNAGAVGGGRPTVSAAVDNALRTLLALMALDRKGEPPARVEAREIGGVRVTGFVGGSAPGPFAYATGPGFVVLGTTAESVAAFAGGPSASIESTRFAALRAEYFAEANSYAYADAASLARFVSTRRDALASRLAVDRGGTEADARRDLDGALGLLKLLRAAFAASVVAPDATWAHRTAGLIAREP